MSFNLTILNASGKECLRKPFVEIVQRANLVLLLNSSIDDFRKISAQANGDVFRLPELVFIDSSEDYECAKQALKYQAELWEKLKNLSVNRMKFAGVLTSDLHDILFNELLIYSALEKISEMSCEDVVVIRDETSMVGSAAFPEFAQFKGLKSHRYLRLKDGSLCEDTTDHIDDAAASMPFPKSKSNLFDLNISTHKLLDHSEWEYQLSSTAFVQRPVLFFITNSSALQSRHSLEILRALHRNGASVHIGTFVKKIDSIADYGEMATTKVSRSHSASLQEESTNCASFVAMFMRQIWEESGSVSAALALRLTYESNLLENLISSRMVQLVGSRRLINEVAPISIWVPEVKSGASRAVVEAAWGRCPLYTAHSATVTHHIRNLPIVEPKSVQLASGRQVIDAYEHRGLSNPPVVLVGGAFYDPYFTPVFAKKRQQVRKKLGVDLEGHLAVVMTARMNPEIEDEWLPRVFDWCLANQFNVLIKAHPNRVDRFEELISSYKDNISIIIDRKMSSYDAISASDLVISDASNAAIEAAIAKKPLVQVSVAGAKIRYNDLSEFGVSTIASSIDKIEEVLSSEWSHPSTDDASYERFSAHFNFGADGGAAERSAQLIMKAEHVGTERISALDLIKKACSLPDV